MIKLAELYSPHVLITRPPASFLKVTGDQKLRYDLEWPKHITTVGVLNKIFTENFVPPEQIFPEPNSSDSSHHLIRYAYFSCEVPMRICPALGLT